MVGVKPRKDPKYGVERMSLVSFGFDFGLNLEAKLTADAIQFTARGGYRMVSLIGVYL